MHDRPAVFVSSTCYDLGQHRQDLRTFIAGLGLVPLLSEYPSFPVDPDLSTLDNCRKVVATSADIFVLVVGGRYGSVADGGQSITNIEYVEAVRKRIPVYVFIAKSVQTTLGIWRSNRDGDFSTVVESTKVFDFIEAIYASNRWVYPFDSADDIKGILGEQLPRLFKDALNIRLRLAERPLSETLASLEGESLRLVLERSSLWEFRLLAAVLKDEKARSRDAQRDYESGLHIAPIRAIREALQVGAAIQDQMYALNKNFDDLNRVKNRLDGAIGPDGEDGDAEAIVWCGRRLGELRRYALTTATAFDNTELPEDFVPLQQLLSRAWAAAIKNLGRAIDVVDAWAMAHFDGLPHDEKEFHWIAEQPDFTGLPELFERLKDKYGVPPPFSEKFFHSSEP
jgi:hypothetical protein